MTRPLTRFALLLAAVATFAAGGAWAQNFTITDSTSSKATTCSTSSTSGLTITFSPPGCLGLTDTPPTGTDPVFSVRLASAATTQPPTGAVGVQSVQVFVDADKDVTAEYTLTLNLCTSTQNCTSANSANWYFFRYSQLGGAGFTRKDAVTTGSYTFTFQPGANTGTANMRSMGVGRMDVLNTPLFSGSASVMFSLSGAKAATNVVIHTINGGEQVIGGTEYDVNNNPIPAPSGPVGAHMVCNYPSYTAYNTPSPGTGPGPCGAYEVPVGNCSSGMTGTNAITRAWMYILEDYTPTSPRIGTGILSGFPRDTAVILRFKTGPAGVFPPDGFRNFGVGFSAQQATHGPNAPRFITLSETKCDFDYTKAYSVTPGSLNGCYQAMGAEGGLAGKIFTTGSVPTPLAAFPYCPMKPDTVYYLNIRYENPSVPSAKGAISCPPNQGPQGSSQCGQAIVFQ